MIVTKSKIKKLIQESLREVYDQGSETVNEAAMMSKYSKEIHNKGMACCNMDSTSMFSMCEEICANNADKYKVCAVLCACASMKDHEGCCRCLAQICQCPTCHNICTQHCGC